MAHTVTEVKEFDHKRNRVTLDNGEVTFPLYKGECRKLRITAAEPAAAGPGSGLGDETYRQIMEDILLPRAKKRILHYLKNGDKSREQIRRKLREGYYPGEIIDRTFAFLDKYGFADDAGYAERLIDELRGTKSVREIGAKLAQKGIRGEEIKALLEEIPAEEEEAACLDVLRKKYRFGIGPEDRKKAFAYLARRGFSFDSIGKAMEKLGCSLPGEETGYGDND